MFVSAGHFRKQERIIRKFVPDATSNGQEEGEDEEHTAPNKVMF